MKRSGLLNFSEKRILLTGADGFLGHHLQKSFLSQGAKIFGLSRNKKPRNPVSHPNNTIIIGDILYSDNIHDALKISEPDIIIHLAAQSHVGASFLDPVQTCEINCRGTTNLLETIQGSKYDPQIIFPGSADEYGLVISSQTQYDNILAENKKVFPNPTRIPEVPVSEENPLRPVSPYGISKVYGDFMMRSYHNSYGMKNIVIRSFNIEGQGRGENFVTSTLARQIIEFKRGQVSSIQIGNVAVFRDFTHVSDAVAGYCSVIDRGQYGEVYNLGSMRATSILTYLLHSIEAAGYSVLSLSSYNNSFYCKDPLILKDYELFGVRGEYSKIDRLIANNLSLFSLGSGGINVLTDKGTIPISIDPERFRPSDNPFIIADIKKIKNLGYFPRMSIQEVCRDIVCSYE